MISRIIKVEVGVSQSWPWVITVNRPRRGSQCNIGWIERAENMVFFENNCCEIQIHVVKIQLQLKLFGKPFKWHKQRNTTLLQIKQLILILFFYFSVLLFHFSYRLPSGWQSARKELQTTNCMERKIKTKPGSFQLPTSACCNRLPPHLSLSISINVLLIIVIIITIIK